MRRPYQFALLRYVFDQASGEFANIGLVLWTLDDRQGAFLLAGRYGRLSTFFRDGFDGRVYRQVVEAARARFEEVLSQVNEQGRADMFSKVPIRLPDVLPMLVPNDSTALQWSPVMSGAHAEPMSQLIPLFQEFIERHEERPERHPRTEEQIWSTVSRDLRQRPFALEHKLRFDVPVAGGGYEWQFKVGWQNGVSQFLEPIAFDLAGSDDIVEKAIKWSGRLLTLSRDNQFRMTAVVAPPSIPKSRDAYRAAVKILRDAPSVRDVVPEDQYASVVPEWIASDLKAAEEH